MLVIVIPILILILLILQGFFTNSEMAVVSSNKIRLLYLSNQGNKRAKIINNLLNQPERLFGTTLLSINLITVTISMLFDKYFSNVVYQNISFIEKFIPLKLFIILSIEPIILIFGELYPMSIGRKYPNTSALRNAYLIKLAYIIMYPFMIVIGSFSSVIEFIFKLKKQDRMSREDLKIIVTRGFLSSITKNTQNYINEALSISELRACDVMVHINDVNAINEDALISDLKKIIKKTGNSRIPVYKDNIINITRTIHAMNILGVDEKEPIINYCDKLYIIPSTKPIIQILKELRKNRKYMGIIVDEYGAVCGIITLEDIVEKIIGDEDFINKDKNNIILKKNEFEGSMRLNDLFDETGIDLKNDVATTINGIINYAAGRIARKGEIITYKNFKFEILEATDRVVNKVKIIQ
ncbi:MAG: HlyC/CorC family transporter [Spirochaetes bacterium]|nr:HlyC/CorC family transporter [Spirochaetota bacterium]